MVKPITSNSPKVGFNSVLIKCALLCGLVVFAVMAVVEWSAIKAERETMSSALSDRALEVSTLLAQQMGGSIKFSNKVAIQTIVDEVLAETQPDAVGIWVADGVLEPLYQASSSDMNLDQVHELAQLALETGQPARSASGFVVAIPSFFGNADAVAGVIVTEWTDAQMLAHLKEATTRNLTIGAGAFLLGQLGLAVFLWMTVSRPLTRLEAAMGRVAQEDYETEVPFAQRKDEIGLIAQRLQRFRDALATGKDTQIQATFQSAAFQGSTAPMMMVDRNFEVLFVNKACLALLEGLGHDLTALWSSFDPASVIGSDLSLFSPLQQVTKDVEAAGAESLPQSVNVRIGSQIIRVKMSAALDEAGNMMGAVIEWSDRTVSQRNAAVLSSIDDNQLRLEFAADGSCSEANTNAQELFGSADGLSLSSVMNAAQAANAVPDDVTGAVLRGEALRGTFDMTGRTGDVFVDGGFAIVQTPDGGMERAIFLGTDVTDSTMVLRKARDEQARISQEQSDVVAALEAHLKLLAGGDLSADIKSVFPEQYEALRRDFNNAVYALAQAITAVGNNATSIRSETDEISNAAEDLSRRTEKQAATLEETAAAIEQLTSSVKSASEGADAASTMAQTAQKNAENGGSVARDAVRAMDGIKTSSQEISKITSVIDDIAFQTNLLALNAGVEAARAGDAGRGFAVVATEVRALAQRSSEAAREINELISASGAQVQEGVDLVDQTGAALGSIVSSIAEITNRVTEIATSSREQASGLQQINEAMNELDSVTQQNAAMFEETTAASHALISETDALVKAVAVFKLAGGGMASHLATPKAASKATPAQPATQSRNAPPAASRQRGNAALQMDQDDVAPAFEPDGWEEF